MASVRVEIVIEAGAEHVWAAVADAGAVHRHLLPGRVLPHDRAPEVRARCTVAIGEMKDVLEAAQPASTESGGRS
jgi:carbon monoxide dehydrogenase subunit G